MTVFFNMFILKTHRSVLIMREGFVSWAKTIYK